MYIHTYMCVYIYIYIHTHVYMSIYVYTYSYLSLSLYIDIYIYIHISSRCCSMHQRRHALSVKGGIIRDITITITISNIV